MEEPPAKKVALSSLEKLKKLSVVVADTGDFEQIQAYKPKDGTTNPSLLLQAVQKKEYAHLVDDAISHGKRSGLTGEEQVDEVCDKLAVNFGCAILKIVPGVVSTEVDASLSFDTQGAIAKGRKLISLYKEAGIDKSRILIKLATTWEGCQAAKVLEAEGIHTNMTLLFSMAQAKAAAEAGATLISPFVGRILDWHKKNNAELKIDKPADDPGVMSVTEIYNYYKRCGHKTVVMGASFRNVQEVLALAGCDKLTISPKLLEELSRSHEEFEQSLKPTAGSDAEKPEPLTEAQFRWELNEDTMATDKLAEGIRQFNKDGNKLKETVRAKLAA